MPNRTFKASRRALFLAWLGLLAMLPISGFASDPVNGQRLYSAHCAGCHGVDGVSVMKQAPNLATPEIFTQSDQVLLEIIRPGRNLMPPFLGILKQGEMLDVISFLRTLR